MNAARLLKCLLTAALTSSVLAQDGLTCNNIGETWHHLCNTCSCRDGVTVCTMDRCSADHSPISASSCLAGSKWQDGCDQTCVCDVSGKTRCTLGACPPRVRPGQSLTFIRTAGDPCVSGDSWSRGCNSCRCVDGVAQCTSDRCPSPQRQPLPSCQPDERWEDECGNLCQCTDRGLVSCTLLTCATGQRAGGRLRPILRSGDACLNEGERWTQQCNECDCTSGVVSCTRRLCAVAQLPQTYGECQPGTRWVDECENTCHCTPSGYPSCTLNNCPHGRQEGARVHFLLEEGATCSNEGEPWRQGCSTCECRSGRVACSDRGCARTLLHSVAGTEEPDWMTCADGTTWEDECGNICSCWERQPLCTRMGCPKGRVAGKPVRYFMFDGEECNNEGVSWKDDCNTCTCTDGVVTCTKKFCAKQRQSVRLVTPFMAATCTPGQRWVDECDNICFCPPSGHSACTLKACPPGKRPMVPVRYIHMEGDACTEEGASWRVECNTCRCRSGQVTCSQRPCPGVVRPLLQIDHSPAGVGGDTSQQCEPGAEYRDECDNHCACTQAGLLTCTTRHCAPGKRAGRPRKKLPKAGEPCSSTSASETWLDDCNTCRCVNGLTACTRVVCPRKQQQLDGMPVQECRPGSHWVDECNNQCHCNAGGVTYCTLKACQHGQQYGTAKMFVLGVNDTCREQGATWKQDCNTCTCTESRVTCTQEICEEESNGVRARFAFGPRCAAGSKWTDECGNTCRCTSSGQPACSLKACAPGKTAGVAVEELPQEGDTCSSEGRSWTEDCSKCTCTGGQVRCSDQLCTPQALPASEDGACAEGEEWIDECTNRCRCIEGEPRCTRRPCPPGSRPGVPVRFIVPDGDSCENEGEQWRDDCNTCKCSRGRVSCTKKSCVGLQRGGGDRKPGECPFVPPGTLGICINGCNGDDMCPDDQKCCSNGCGAMCMKPDSCLEGTVWKEECNTCECINGVPACTKKFCHKEINVDTPGSATPPSKNEPQQGTCLEGSVWMNECNICDCINGKEVCTKRLCPPRGNPIDEVSGECREDSVWRKDCNKCRCIDGRAICTLKQCKPGDSNAAPESGTGDICRLPPVDLAEEPCGGFIRRWTYDFTKKRCRRYVYGGCHGTANLFRTRKACRRRCETQSLKKTGASCKLPVDSGTCFDIVPRYYFDTTANKCRQFGFSGCGGNQNNFENLASCISTCGGTYTSEDTACDRGRCPWSYYKHYIEEGCEPVYDRQRCCPVRFNCPDSSASAGATEPCVYRGQKYNHGDRVEAASRLDPCKKDCVCRSSAQDGPSIECAEVDCPARVWNQLSAGCVPLYLPDRCCPVSVSCDIRRRRRSTDLLFPTDPTSISTRYMCHVEGRTYVAGQLIPSHGDPCTACICGPDYSGRDGPGCRRTECLNLTGAGRRDCAPVYRAGVCCPVDWTCPEDLVKQTSLGPRLEHDRRSLTNPACQLPKRRGPCERNLDRYYFDSEAQRCVPFVYGGCYGNSNNFRTLDQCSRLCDTNTTRKPFPSETSAAMLSLLSGVCHLPPASGGCSERHLSFFYNASSATCQPFQYSDCGGNGNRFASKQNCESSCVPAEQQAFCSLPAERGFCYSSVERYHFDSRSGSCESFVYSGCGGNRNNFASREQCYNKCGLDTVPTKQHAHFVLSVCLAAADPGPCRRWEVRYHFDEITGTCQPFRYGGCRGNGNRFATRAQCTSACGGVLTRIAGSEAQCQFAGRSVRRGETVDVQQKCTICECRSPPKLTCRKLHCPQIPAGLESRCRYSQLDPGACCPEMICDVSVDIIPNLSPECGQQHCHLSAAGAGCSVIYRPGDCCPEVHCTRPLDFDSRLAALEDTFLCERTECPKGCQTGRDLYGCVVCNCSDIHTQSLKIAPIELLVDVPLAARSGSSYSPGPTQRRCERQFCPRGCPSHYGDDGCIVCECEHSRKGRMAPSTVGTTPPTTTREPCVSVTCRPGCTHQLDDRGCTICDCGFPSTRPPISTTPRPCPVVTCWPGCGYKLNDRGCRVCDCPVSTTPWYPTPRSTTTPPRPSRPPCPTVTCRPGCGYKRDHRGCTVCDCPTTTTRLITTLTPSRCPMVTCRPGCGHKRNEQGCTVCDCPVKTPYIITTTTPSPCPIVTCWPGCGYKKNEHGCTVCDCPVTTPYTTTPTPSTCPMVTCWPGCGYKRNEQGCTVCDCLVITTAFTPTPPPSLCPSITCKPECGYKRNERGCTVCDCPKSTTLKPFTSTSCLPVTCDDGCRVESDDEGCARCRCPGLVDLLMSETRQCPKVRCPTRCVLAEGEDGCAHCQCPHDISSPQNPGNHNLYCPPCHCTSSQLSEKLQLSLSSLSMSCPDIECPAHCDLRLDSSGCAACSCDTAGRPGCARVTCPIGCRTVPEPESGCPSCLCDACPLCECADHVQMGRSCPISVCPAHCTRRLADDSCYHCICDSASADWSDSLFSRWR